MMTTLFAMSNGLFLLCLVVGVIGTIWYIINPLIGILTYRVSTEPTSEAIDGILYPVPEAAQERLEHDRRQLIAAGFVPLQASILQGFAANIESLRYPFVNRDKSRTALITVILIATAQNRSLHLLETRICGDYQGGSVDELSVIKTSATGPFYRRKRERSYLFPHVRDVDQLIELFDRIEQRDFADASRVLKLDTEFQGNAQAWNNARSKLALSTMCDQGALVRIEGEPKYRMPLKSYYWIAWHTWWPMRVFFRVLLASQGKRLQRELLEN
ncbi:MAG: hypothetical protein JWM11_1321 [Planctomycetaceae bacterium]|nr:hypothetical protein [Planctomycetaceae bacterium]